MSYFDGSGEQEQDHYLQQVQQAAIQVRETGGIGEIKCHGKIKRNSAKPN